jgi:CRP-like cAMP-binding protein
LFHDVPDMVTVTNATRFGESKDTLIDLWCPGLLGQALLECQKIRQRDIAAMAGTARENVTRVLNDWQRCELVSRVSGYYCLENKALLEHQVKH